MKHKRDDEPEKQEDEAVDVTPVMTCVFVVMCCSMLVLLYYFYDHLGASPRAVAPLEKSSGQQGERRASGWVCPLPLPREGHPAQVQECTGPFLGVGGCWDPAARLSPHCHLALQST